MVRATGGERLKGMAVAVAASSPEALTKQLESTRGDRRLRLRLWLRIHCRSVDGFSR